MTDLSDPSIVAWYRRNTFGVRDHAFRSLLELKTKSDTSVGVCLPALDEQGTVGVICRTIHDQLVAPGLVDRLVVMDSGSSDATGELAAAAGAEVVRAKDVLPNAGPSNGGKGESLWKSLAVIDCDIVLWLDSDTTNFRSGFVTSLLGPLFEDPDLIFVKGYYERPLARDGGTDEMGGGRVTEIAIRPLLNLLHPSLAGFIQPLAGEYGGRRSALLEVPFRTGYDVDVVLLVDLMERFGLDALAQADLGRREHRNRGTEALGRMSFEVTRGLLLRLEEIGRIKTVGELPDDFVQFASRGATWSPRAWTSNAQERPPMGSILRSP